MSNLPDYYKILDISPTATQDEVREAYKKQALLYHPDRLADTANAEERQEATKKFQLIADAFYILGDRSRREIYDKNYKNVDSSNTAPKSTTSQAFNVFGNTFEELLRPEVDHPSHIWKLLGVSAGAVLGYIIGNVPGAAVGALAGKTLGQVRDNKGVSVYTAFQKLNNDQRRDILTTLLTRFLAAGASGMMK
ncbi:DnaJ-domain-containing protein [Backusella circina FSU 941]|nr:DnaJ-domain-containing protein [Backusella circina FSU 941]